MSFSPSSAANTVLTARDGITNQTLVRGPLLDNESSGNGHAENNFSFGTHQGLVVYNGEAMPVWSGNLDGGVNGGQALDILTSNVRIASGPRIVSSTMGPIGQVGDTLNTHPVSPFSTVNPPNPLAAPTITDNTPVANAFQVTFDRPIPFDNSFSNDPNVFDLSDIKVFYHDLNSADPFVQVPVTSMQALDNGPFGATRFTIHFTPQTKTGTYSYEIIPNLRDRIRSYGLQTIDVAPVDGTSSALQIIPPAGTGGTGTPNDTYSNNLTLTGHPGQTIAPTGLSITLNLSHQSPTNLLITLTYNGSVNRTVTIYDGTKYPTGPVQRHDRQHHCLQQLARRCHVHRHHHRQRGQQHRLLHELVAAHQRAAQQLVQQVGADGPERRRQGPQHESTQLQRPLRRPHSPERRPLQPQQRPVPRRAVRPPHDAPDPHRPLRHRVLHPRRLRREPHPRPQPGRLVDRRGLRPRHRSNLVHRRSNPPRHGPHRRHHRRRRPVHRHPDQAQHLPSHLAHPQAYSGTYSIQIGKAKSDANGNQTISIRDIYGNPIDTNLNAGLAVLRGGLGSTNETSVTTTVPAIVRQRHRRRSRRQHRPRHRPAHRTRHPRLLPQLRR